MKKIHIKIRISNWM